MAGAQAVYTLGIDFGSQSVRCVVVDVRDGREVGSAAFPYPSGVNGVLGDPKDPHLARQNPRDYLDGLAAVVPAALKPAALAVKGFTPAQVVGIGVDTTGSTPIPVDERLRPLAFQKKFATNPNAMAWMWKDHTAMDEAARITGLAAKLHPEYLAKCGGTYSAEWFFAKIWHCRKVDPAVFAAAHTWIEFADFIPAVLAGVTAAKDLKAGICAAGHKAMFNAEWGGYPERKFLAKLDPALGKLRDRLAATAYAADQPAGQLGAEWAETLGLKAGIPVTVGAFDAHLGAVGAGCAPGRMVKIIGTSTCDCLVAPAKAKVPDIPGVCGIVRGSILPGLVGIEAGQSAVGDIFEWFVTKICQADKGHFKQLTAAAAALKPGESGLLALDWNNGNRTVLADPRLTGLMLGMTLHTTQAEMYRALVEATAFGARRILDRIEEYGVKVKEVVCCGGIAEKDALFMQIYADVLGRPMKVSRSAQACALGGAVMAAVAAGVYRKAEDAQRAMCGFKEKVYKPAAAARKVYDKLYALYGELHDSFGVKGATFDHAGVMKQLLAISKAAKG
ncbi:MAG: ribulokinase [Lentisphaeria bacterium]|jgi:L-ribulokinase